MQNGSSELAEIVLWQGLVNGLDTCIARQLAFNPESALHMKDEVFKESFDHPFISQDQIRSLKMPEKRTVYVFRYDGRGEQLLLDAEFGTDLPPYCVSAQDFFAAKLGWIVNRDYHPLLGTQQDVLYVSSVSSNASSKSRFRNDWSDLSGPSVLRSLEGDLRHPLKGGRLVGSLISWATFFQSDCDQLLNVLQEMSILKSAPAGYATTALLHKEREGPLSIDDLYEACELYSTQPASVLRYQRYLSTHEATEELTAWDLEHSEFGNDLFMFDYELQELRVILKKLLELGFSILSVSRLAELKSRGNSIA